MRIPRRTSTRPNFVPTDVALARDALVKAFVAGNMDEYARLTQELRALLMVGRSWSCGLPPYSEPLTLVD